MAEYNWPYPDEFGQTETVEDLQDVLRRSRQQEKGKK